MTNSRKSRVNWSEVRERLTHSESALSDTFTFSEDKLAEIYSRRAAQLAKRQTGVSTSAKKSVLVFKLDKESYAIDLADLAEVLTYRGCTPVPGGPPALLGLINVRGEIRPVVDVSRLLQLEHAANDAGYVLMLRRQDSVVGLKVDVIEHIREIGPEEIIPTEKEHHELETRHLTGMTQDTLMLIDTGSLIDELG